jgi:DNA polymerase-1
MSNLLGVDLGKDDYQPKRRTVCKSKRMIQTKLFEQLSEELTESPCDKCSIKGKPIPSRTATGKHPVMFIGMYPGRIEVEEGEFFVGDSGQYLISVLKRKGFDIEKEAYMTNILRCPKPKGEISKEDLKCCGEFTIREIRKVEPSLIVLMGDLPLRYFFNQKSVTTSRGQVKLKGDYKFLITYNPAHIIREKEEAIDEKAFEGDIQTVYEIFKGVKRKGDRDYVLIKTYEQLDQIVEFFKGEKALSIDVETYAPGGEKEKKALDPYSEGFKILSIAISSVENTGFCFLLEHPENQLNYLTVLSKLKPLLESPIPKLGQNIKYDFKVLGVHCNVFLKNIVFDAMLAHSLIDDRKGTHNLDRLALDFLGEQSYKFEMGKIGTYIPRAEDLCIRNCTDSDYVLRLYPIFVKKLKEIGMYDYFMEVMIPSLPALGLAEIRGIPANKERVAYLISNPEKTGYMDKMEVYEAQAKAFPQVQEIPNFNIRSSQDLGILLFDKFKFPVIRKTSTKKASVDKDVVEELFGKHDHPFLTVLKNYRDCQKILSTYLLPYLKKHIKRDGRVHPTFTQHIAATGRLSCINPNMQNVPVRIQAAEDIMSIFFREGWKIGLADYSAMELRILAAASNDPKLIDIFDKGLDPHQITADQLSKLTGEKISRDDGKSFNFGIVYGMTEHGFAERLGVSLTVAREYMKAYFELFKGVEDYQNRMRSQLRQYGYVETLFGRKRCIRMRGSDDDHALRQAINTPIQGTATDINTIAMAKLVNIYVEHGFESFPISLIHDSIMFEMHPDEEEIRDLNMAVMTTLDLPFMKSIKLRVDWTSGDTWADAKLKN